MDPGCWNLHPSHPCSSCQDHLARQQAVATDKDDGKCMVRENQRFTFTYPFRNLSINVTQTSPHFGNLLQLVPIVTTQSNRGCLVNTYLLHSVRQGKTRLQDVPETNLMIELPRSQTHNKMPQKNTRKHFFFLLALWKKRTFPTKNIHVCTGSPTHRESSASHSHWSKQKRRRIRKKSSLSEYNI